MGTGRGHPRRERPFSVEAPAWFAAPGLAYYALLFVVPLAIVLAVSFGRPVGYGNVAFGFELDNYERALQGIYLEVLLRTLGFALAGTALVLALALPTAYWLARHAGRWRTLILVALVVPYWTSFLVRTFAFLILLSPDLPFVAGVRALGWSSFDPLGTPWAVLMGIVYNYLPLAVLPLYAAIERVDWRQVEAARDLGATAAGAFRQVTLPSALPGVVTATLLVFVPMSGEYVVPQLLGTGTDPLLANLIGDQFLQAQDYPFGAALAAVLISSAGLVALVALLLGQRRQARVAP